MFFLNLNSSARRARRNIPGETLTMQRGTCLERIKSDNELIMDFFWSCNINMR